MELSWKPCRCFPSATVSAAAGPAFRRFYRTAYTLLCFLRANTDERCWKPASLASLYGLRSSYGLRHGTDLFQLNLGRWEGESPGTPASVLLSRGYSGLACFSPSRSPCCS